QTSENLMQQIAKITKVVNPDMKIFVGDSLAGNDTVNQAREFFKHVQFDASILTKSDADAKGGAALSIVKVTSTPIIYLGIGQEYPDLKPFNKDTFLKDVFGSLDDVDIKGSPEPEPQLESSEPEPQLESPEPDIVEKPVTQSQDDPFEGISDDDIATYSDLYDIPPPENDDDAIKSGNNIRKWIKDGRLEPGESKTNEKIADNIHKQDKEEELKKKRGRFGFLRK
ncbi:MAG: signal recognition particle-docking protein FtsY, partial [Nitrosopumilus sp.]